MYPPELILGTPGILLFVEIIAGWFAALDNASGTERFLNRFYYMNTTTGPYTTPTELQLFAAFCTTVGTPLSKVISNKATAANGFNSVRFMDDPQRAKVLVSGMPAGTIDACRFPGFVCVNVALHTMLRQKGGTGHKYFALPMGAQCDVCDTIDPAYDAAWVSVATALKTPLTPDGGSVWTPILINKGKDSGTTLNVSPIQVQPQVITQPVVHAGLTTLKKRKRIGFGDE